MSKDTLDFFSSALTQARKVNASKVAVRIIDNKTDSCLVWMTPEEKAVYDRLHKRKGQSSKLRNVLVGNGRLL